MKKCINLKPVAISSLFLAAAFSSSSQAADLEGMVGIGAGYVDLPWKGQDKFATAMPFVSLEYGNWELFSKGLVAYNWINHEEFSLYTGLDYRDDTYDADDLTNSEKSKDPVFDGYKSPDGDATFRAGGHWKWFSLDVQQDISDHSEGLTVDAGIEIPLLQYQERFVVSASAGVHWGSSKYANYVYGITGNQVDVSKGRTEYQPGSITNYSIGLSAHYMIDQNWAVIGGVSYSKLDEKIEKSPLIDSDEIQLAYVAVAYNF